MKKKIVIIVIGVVEKILIDVVEELSKKTEV